MMFRKNVVTAAITCLFLVLAACGGDDESSFAPRDDESSSSIEEESSSSSVTLSGASAESNGSSSSSAKSSPSTDSKSSSSVKSSNSGGSSSSMKACTEEGHMIQRTNSKTNERDWYVCQDGFYVPYIESSSSSVPTSSYFDMDSLYNSTKSYGEFKDPRDGQTYKTIVVAPGWVSLQEFEVFAQNLNYGTQVKLGTLEFDDSRVEKFCYDDDPWYCDNGFGGLYSWSEAMGLPKACDSVWTGTTPACPDSIFPGWKYEEEWRDLMIQGACPEGWHVMNETEWRALMALDVTESGFAITSKVSAGRNRDANGTGFSALYGGMTELPTQYVRIVELGVYHLAFEYEAERHKSVTMSDQTDISYEGIHYKKDGLSVRCVKDY